jgi:hypothetical protein
MQSIKLDHFNTFMITMIILIFIIYYVMKYNEIIENFNTYGYVACPPQFTKVENTQNMYYNVGNIGIGNDNPTHKLDVNGDINIPTGSSFKINGSAIPTTRTTYSGGTGISISGTTISSVITQYEDSNVNSYITTTGINGALKIQQIRRNDGIIEQVSYKKWFTNGDCMHIKCGDAYIKLYDDNDIQFSKDISDERVKTNIIKVNDNTQYMLYFRECNMYKYNFKSKLEENPEDIPDDGFIAQELEKIIPKAVSKSKDTIRDIDTKCTIINDIIELDINGKINYDIKENDILELKDDSSNTINITIKNIIDKNKYIIYSYEDINYNANYKVTGHVEDDIRHLNYNTLTRISIGAIKYLDSEVAKLKDIIEKQEKQIELLIKSLKN